MKLSGDDRTTYPLTCYLVAGTQAEAGRQNFVVLMKMYDLRSTNREEDDDEGKSQRVAISVYLC